MPPVPAEQPPAPPPDGAAPGAVPAPGQAADGTNQLGRITITFRAVSLKDSTGKADADKAIAYTVEQELRNSPLFESDPQQTHTTSEVSSDPQTGTFTFSVVAKLKQPLRL
jgi:hypothetical protein